MGIILKTYTVTGITPGGDSAQVRALFDTGADLSLVRQDIAENLEEFKTIRHPLRLGMADGDAVLRTNQTVELYVYIDDLPLAHMFYVAENLGEEMIIGADMMQQWKIKLDPEQEDIMPIDPRVLRMRV